MNVKIAALVLALIVLPASVEAVIVDSMGDEQLRTAGEPVGPSDAPQVDILALEILEDTADRLVLALEMGATQSTQDDATPLDLRSYAIEFLFGQIPYSLAMPDGRCLQGQAALLMMDVVDGTKVDCTAVYVDDRAGSIEFTIRKDALIDEDGVGPRRNSELTDLRVEVSELVSFVGFATEHFDVAPDDGPGATYTLQSTRHQLNGIELAPLQAIRYSNGGGGAFAYPIVASSNASQPRLLEFRVDWAPNDWGVHVPQQLLVEPDRETTFPVVISTPFGHQHGGREAARILVSDGESELALELGISYLTIPQPAGHHPTLHLHGGESNHRWMNTISEDGNGLPVGHQQQFIEGSNWHARWVFPLEPSLRLGLHFQDAGDADLDLSFVTPGHTYEGDVHAHVAYCPGAGGLTGGDSSPACAEGATILAAGGRPITMTGTPTINEVTLELLRPGVKIPPAQGSNLYLVIETSTLMPEGGPREVMTRIVPRESVLSLPLLEYRDELDDAIETNDVALKLLSSPDLSIAPGSTGYVSYEVVAESEGTVRVVGADQNWIEFATSPEFMSGRLASQGLVEVHVPAEAPSGYVAEYFLIAESGAASVASKFRVEVEAGAPAMERPKIGLQDEVQDAPSAFGLAALVVAAIVARRR